MTHCIEIFQRLLVFWQQHSMGKSKRIRRRNPNRRFHNSFFPWISDISLPDFYQRNPCNSSDVSLSIAALASLGFHGQYINGELQLLDCYQRSNRLTGKFRLRWGPFWWSLHFWFAWQPIVQMVVMDMVPVERTTCALATIELMEILLGFIPTAPEEVALCL